VAADTGAFQARTGDYDLDGWPEPRGSLTPAAVLVALVRRDPELTLLLTQRTGHLTDHAGQISFPGGRMEHGDAGPVATALRETEEELGIGPSFVEVAGYLDSYETVTGFLVVPVVGFVAPGFRLRPDPHEVADAFEVPLSFILDPRNQQTHTRTLRNRPRSYYVFEYGHRYIWGATAGMLVNLGRRVRGEARV